MSNLLAILQKRKLDSVETTRLTCANGMLEIHDAVFDVWIYQKRLDKSKLFQEPRQNRDEIINFYEDLQQ